MNEILPSLFLGNVEAARDVEMLKRRNVKAVLTVMRYKGMPDCYHVHLPKDFTHLHIDVYDAADAESSLLPHLARCVAFISEGRRAGGVLVHCFAGVSRSATAVVAYLLSQVQHSVRW